LPPSWEGTDAGVAGECIVGPALAERELSTRMQHDAFANVNVLRSHWGRGSAGSSPPRSTPGRASRSCAALRG
jgi:hypothetical protein